MNILYFNPGRSIFGKRLLATIKSKKLSSNISVFRDLGTFSERLRQPETGQTTAIVLAPTTKDLLDIYFIKYLFCNIPIVLLLPDRQGDTAAAAHRCGSRSILYLDSDLSEIINTLHSVGKSANFRRQDDDYEDRQYEAA
jgi:hypothetical protein